MRQARMRQAKRSGAQAEATGLPLVIVSAIKNATRLYAVSPQAKRLGLYSGLTLADARTRIPDLWVEEADHRADAALLQQIGEDCDRFSPVVVVDAPDGLLLDITGCSHLFGGESELRQALMRRLRLAGLHVRCVIAGASEAARALARHARGSALMPDGIVPGGEDEAAVRPLPIAALGLDDDTRIAIQRAGFKTVGAVADQPMTAFASRFGEAMTLQLRRVLGREDAPVSPLRPAPDLWVERRFADPIGRSEDIEAALEELGSEAGAMLAELKQGGRVFEANFFRADGAVRRVSIETGRPMRDPKTLLRLFREKLDALTDPIDPGFGFDVIRLCVAAAEPLEAIQSRLDGGAIGQDEVADLADRLATRFGQDRVLRFLPRDTHDPDRAAEAAPAGFNPFTSPVWQAPEKDEPPLRPMQIFDPPQPVSVTAEIPDGPPRSFLWRKVRCVVKRSEGPERIAPEWWRAPEGVQSRDYYRIEDQQGRRFWLFRAGQYGEKPDPNWYVHGLFA